MNPESEYLDAAQSIAAARGFPRGDARAKIAAECATVLEAECETATQAQRAASDFLRTETRWPGMAAFERFLREWIAKDRGTTGLAELGRAWRAAKDPQCPHWNFSHQHFFGFPIPAWVRPFSATDDDIGRNILRLRTETDQRIERELKQLTPARRRALYERALRVQQNLTHNSGKTPQELKDAIRLQMIFDLGTMHHFAGEDGLPLGQPIGENFEKYLPLCAGAISTG